MPRSPESGRERVRLDPALRGNLDTTKSVIATFFQVFPHGILWSNEREGVATTSSCSARSSRR